MCRQWRKDCRLPYASLSAFFRKLIEDCGPVTILALRCRCENHVAFRKTIVGHKRCPKSCRNRGLPGARQAFNNNDALFWFSLRRGEETFFNNCLAQREGPSLVVQQFKWGTLRVQNLRAYLCYKPALLAITAG